MVKARAWHDTWTYACPLACSSLLVSLVFSLGHWLPPELVGKSDIWCSVFRSFWTTAWWPRAHQSIASRQQHQLLPPHCANGPPGLPLQIMGSQCIALHWSKDWPSRMASFVLYVFSSSFLQCFHFEIGREKFCTCFFFFSFLFFLFEWTGKEYHFLTQEGQMGERDKAEEIEKNGEKQKSNWISKAEGNGYIAHHFQ